MTSRYRTGKSKPPRLTAEDYMPALVDRSVNPLRQKGPRPLVHLSAGQYLVQNPNLSCLRGQVGLNGDHPAELDAEDPIPTVPPTQHTNNDIEFSIPEHLGHEAPLPPLKSVNWKKKEQQWKQWLKEVIPTLVEPYMELLQTTNNLHETAPLHLADRCSCNGGHYVEVSVLRFNSIKKLNVWFCSKCSPTGPQLVRSGFFPCAPFAPTLVTEILEDYLLSQGYWLRGQDPLQRRFRNCLLWFTSLQDAVHTLLKSTIENTRLELLRKDPIVKNKQVSGTTGVNHPEPNEDEREYELSIETSRKRKRGGLTNCLLPPPTSLPLSLPPASPPTPQPASSPPSSSPQDQNPLPKPCRASAYLRSHCPLCFGGTSTPNATDATEAGPRIIVMLDACFTHKHRDQHGWDSPRLHPDTLFIPEEEVKMWEAKVDEACSSKTAKRAKKDMEAQDDHYEHGMRVPKSTLDQKHPAPVTITLGMVHCYAHMM
ncbi:hypothetical protein VKT23_016601 [Stygiomarasmius scandens]|uniref:CxC2-like cysteine cluster KDZ transposase-associated domain-containing protein n=1 Tax=Marasmiellus scandens TaxID=2682957 RepID=A0ABR1IVZ7_9AGAR